ncbi:MAG: cytochrome P460 family protein [Wenzhouxiangellaceae bacterium]
MIASLLLPTLLVAADDAVDYPHDYRQWQHVKSMLIEPGHPLHAAFGGLHHIYANELAVQGYARGQFPDGAVLVFDLLEVNSAEHAVTEAGRKVLGVMQKDTERFAATGGWGFEGFAGGAPGQRVVGTEAATACFACHQPQAEADYVFSQWRD